MRHDIIPPHLAVKSMRDSGYKDAAHAIAELVDNSIQAGANDVQIVCVDRMEFIQQRRRRRVHEIGVLDNGCGMDGDTLRMALQYGNGTHLTPEMQEGIGKFGMGLPNASLSQCKRVDVWSWQNNECRYTYLDLDEILGGSLVEVPEPILSEIPRDWIEKYSGSAIGESGTLVLWRSLDRIRWKSSKSFLEHSEFLIGRMYRYFIHEDDAAIRLKAVLEEDGSAMSVDIDRLALPNDPLYLMKDTSLPLLPSPYDHESMFDEYGQDLVEVTLGNGEKHVVRLVFSIVNNKIRKALTKIHSNPGATAQGKHANKNIGVSVVRAGRELEMNGTFTIGYDPTERWWGVEVSFSPALDEVFGVTNNKQAATNFYKMNLDRDAESEGMTPQEYKEMLIEDGDPRIVIYEISQKIEANLKSIRSQLSRVREGVRKKKEQGADPAAEAATAATKQRQNDGYAGDSDKEESLSKEQRLEALKRALEEAGLDEDEARESATLHVESGLKYQFLEGPYDGPSFFTAQRRGGSILVTVNSEHPVTQYLYDLLEERVEENPDSLLALKLILSAWARMEDEAQEKRKELLSDMRNDWGRITRDFIRAAKETYE